VAISNHRIVSIDNDKVSFRYKDYRSVGTSYADKSRQKTMTLEATEFLRRFCLHILPKGFRKMRYYGFLSNAHSALLQEQQNQMGVGGQAAKDIKKLSWKVIAKQKLNYDADVCPCCRKGRMVTLLHFDANAPPGTKSLNALVSLIKGKTVWPFFLPQVSDRQGICQNCKNKQGK
jgi:hypothetical protein